MRACACVRARVCVCLRVRACVRVCACVCACVRAPIQLLPQNTQLTELHSHTDLLIRAISLHPQFEKSLNTSICEQGREVKTAHCLWN